MKAEIVAVENDALLLVTFDQHTDAVCKALTVKGIGAGVQCVPRGQNDLAIFTFLKSSRPKVNVLDNLLRVEGFEVTVSTFII